MNWNSISWAGLHRPQAPATRPLHPITQTTDVPLLRSSAPLQTACETRKGEGWVQHSNSYRAPGSYHVHSSTEERALTGVSSKTPHGVDKVWPEIWPETWPEVRPAWEAWREVWQEFDLIPGQRFDQRFHMLKFGKLIIQDRDRTSGFTFLVRFTLSKKEGEDSEEGKIEALSTVFPWPGNSADGDSERVGPGGSQRGARRPTAARALLLAFRVCLFPVGPRGSGSVAPSPYHGQGHDHYHGHRHDNLTLNLKPRFKLSGCGQQSQRMPERQWSRSLPLDTSLCPDRTRNGPVQCKTSTWTLSLNVPFCIRSPSRNRDSTLRLPLPGPGRWHFWQGRFIGPTTVTSSRLTTAYQGRVCQCGGRVRARRRAARLRAGAALRGAPLP